MYERLVKDFVKVLSGFDWTADQRLEAVEALLLSMQAQGCIDCKKAGALHDHACNVLSQTELFGEAA